MLEVAMTDFVDINKTNERRPAENFFYNGWSEIFRTKYFSTFDQLESITDESKAMS